MAPTICAIAGAGNRYVLTWGTLSELYRSPTDGDRHYAAAVRLRGAC
jgi:hypothetical protein